MSIYLEVPYQEKDQAKAVGARWDAKVKKWYADTERKKYRTFAPWILTDSDEAYIATEYVYIIEGQRACWKCGKQTRVIGLGIGEHVYLYEDGGRTHCEVVEDYADPGEEIHLAWTSDEERIPPRLLRYLKETYSVKTGYSKAAGTSFANHCDCCGAIQGNWFVFGEPDSPLCPDAEGEELAKKMRKLKIKGIPIEDDLKLQWDIGFSTEDYAYLKYGAYEELILSSDPNNEYISYEEMYRR